MMASRPTAAIFDCGNVLYGWDPDAFLVRQIADDEARLQFIQDTNLWEWHDSLDGGRPFDEAARELSEVYPAYADLISAWGSRSLLPATSSLFRQAGRPRHEDSQFPEVAEVAAPRLPRDPPPGPHLRHKQDQPPLQGAPGLTARKAVIARSVSDEAIQEGTAAGLLRFARNDGWQT